MTITVFFFKLILKSRLSQLSSNANDKLYLTWRLLSQPASQFLREFFSEILSEHSAQPTAIRLVGEMKPIKTC